MRRLTSAIAIALLALAPSSINSNAARRACDCPTVNVSCPDVTPVGAPIIFTAIVSNFSPDSKLTYKWTVSAGTIVSGQGTKSIAVDPVVPKGFTLTATVEVTGLPESCPKSVSCSIIDEPGIFSRKVDEFGNIRFNDEKARLDNFAIELQNDPTSQGYLICYGGRRGRASEARSRCWRAKSYLINARGTEESRVVVLDGGYKEEPAVELYIAPSGATPPVPSPTVGPKEVRIVKGGAKSRRRH
jgi:hypothetical protein